MHYLLLLNIPLTSQCVEGERPRVTREIVLGMVRTPHAVDNKAKKAPGPEYTVELSGMLSDSTCQIIHSSLGFYLLLWDYTLGFFFSPSGAEFTVDAPKGTLDSSGQRKLTFTLAAPEITKQVLSSGVPRTWLQGEATIVCKIEGIASRFWLSLRAILTV